MVLEIREDNSHLVIRLVFPTLWSPSKTILVRFGGADEKSAALESLVGSPWSWMSVESSRIRIINLYLAVDVSQAQAGNPKAGIVLEMIGASSNNPDPAPLIYSH